MDLLINLIEIIISHCMHISNHHVVHLKYTQFLFVNFSSVKLRKIKLNKIKLSGLAKFIKNNHSILLDLVISIHAIIFINNLLRVC